MTTGYIDIPDGGSASWKQPVANAAALPTTGNHDGDARVTLNDQSIYVWKDSTMSWQQAATPAATSAITALNTDVSANGPGAVIATIQPGVVTNAKLATMAANTIKANPTGSTGAPQDVSVATAIGYTPENVANKATTFGILSNVLYPSVLAVSNYVVGLINNYVLKSGDTMTGQLIVPSFKVKSGAHEFYIHWDGSNTFAVDSTDWLGFSAGGVLYFNAQTQVQLNNAGSGSGITMDEFGGISITSNNGFSVSAGPKLTTEDLTVDGGAGGSAHFYPDPSNNRFIIETGSPVGIFIYNGNAWFKLDGSEASMKSEVSGANLSVNGGGGVFGEAFGGGIGLVERSNGNSLYLSADGSVYLNSANGSQMTIEANATLYSSFGQDYTLVHALYGSAMVTLNGSGEMILASLNSSDMSLTSSKDIILASGSGGSVVADMNVLPKIDAGYSIGSDSFNWLDGHFQNIKWGNTAIIEVNNGKLNATDGSGVSIDFSNRNNIQMGGDVTVPGSYYGDAVRTNSLQITGTGGGGILEIPSQNPAPSAPSGGIRYFPNNSGYPTFLDSSGRSISFSLNAISFATNREFTMPNAAGTLALIQNNLTSSTTAAPTIDAVNLAIRSVGVVASTLTLSTNQFYVFTGTTATWTLPSVAGNTGRSYYIKNRGSGSITLNSNAGGNDIYNTSAASTITITAGSALRLVNDGTFWDVI